MKKALLLALVGFFAAVVPSLAYPPAPATVNFSSERGVPFGLVLDGRPLTRGAARQVHVDRLVPGAHWADFTVPTAYGGAVRFRSRVWLEPGLETTFVLIARPGRPLGLRQVGAVALYGPGRSGYNGGRYNSPQPYGQGSYDRNAPDYNVPNNAGYNNGNGAAYPAPGNGYGNNPTGPTGTNGNIPGGYYPGSATSSYRVMPPQDVDALLQTLRQQPGEASKVSTAEKALEQSSLQAEDLERLLRSLGNDASRISLANFAYSHVADPENFSRVYNAFESEASVRVLEQAVGSTPQDQY